MFGIMPNALFTLHRGQGSGRGLSPRLWSRVNSQIVNPDGMDGAVFAGDDFTSFGGSVTSNVGTYSGGYKSYEDTGGSIAQLAAGPTADPWCRGGVIQLATDTTDNDEVWLQSGYSTGTLGAISAGDGTAGTVEGPETKKLTIFEARFRLTQIGNTYNFFIGLAEEGLAAADTIADDPSTNYIADKDHIGFLVNEGNGDNLMFVYNKAGARATNQTTIAISALSALVADTWYKVGFVYDPKADTSERLKVYLDNVENGTRLTAANITADTFPSGEELAFLCGIKNQTTTATKADVDWWAFWQEGG